MNKEYTIISPYWFVQDQSAEEYPVDLAQHENDIYKLLIKKIAAFESIADPSLVDIESIRSVFEEFLRIKEMLRGKE